MVRAKTIIFYPSSVLKLEGSPAWGQQGQTMPSISGFQVEYGTTEEG